MAPQQVVQVPPQVGQAQLAQALEQAQGELALALARVQVLVQVALAEAQRVAAERRLVEGPAPDGSRVLCYDCRTNGERLAALEAHAVETDDTLSFLRGRIDNDGISLAERLAFVERTLEGRTGLEAGL